MNTGSSAGSQDTSNRAASQPLDIALLSSQNNQNPQDPQQQPRHTWGLTHEAQYFADLDAEELVEDGQEAAGAPASCQPAVKSQSKRAAVRHSHGSTRSPKQQGRGSDCSHMQTPDAIALAKYHPDLQVCLHICIYKVNRTGMADVYEVASCCVAECGTLTEELRVQWYRQCLSNVSLVEVLHQSCCTGEDLSEGAAVCLSVCLCVCLSIHLSNCM